MVTSDTIAVPQSPEEAYQVYRDAASAVFLAGAQGLKYKKDHYGLIVDLSKAGLRTLGPFKETIAMAEGLDANARSVRIRLESNR